MMESQELLWLAGAGGLVAGLLLGVLIARAGSRREAARVRLLEKQLEAAEAEQMRYRGQVAEHFGETSRRLRDLTLQYKSVYEHLAEGARSLCPEGAIEIAPSLSEALPAAAGVAHHEESEAQLDLELEPPNRWVASPDDRADALGPLLDEEPPPPRVTS